MRWEAGRRSANVEDRRGSGGGRRAAGGLGGAGLVLGLIVYFVTGDPEQAMQVAMDPNLQTQTRTQAPPPAGPQPDDRLADFVSVVLADTEDVWTELFAARGARYEPPTLVLFRGQVESACGSQDAAVGPFYCPGDRKAYIDLSFYDELQRRFGAPGDFAQAYVLAHEVGHHIQNLTGVSEQVHSARRRLDAVEGNKLSVRQELQADCYAGVWAHHAHKQRQLLEEGDVEEGLRAATAIGDDTLQRNAGRRATPESFTHGSSAQRVQWFRTGLQTGSVAARDTFAG
jgi:predicted metalloprotease